MLSFGALEPVTPFEEVPIEGHVLPISAYASKIARAISINLEGQLLNQSPAKSVLERVTDGDTNQCSTTPYAKSLIKDMPVEHVAPELGLVCKRAPRPGSSESRIALLVPE